MSALTEKQIDRYARHIVMSEIGGRGQRRLMNGKVLIVGSGGLGSPAALYLAAAGVGTIGLIDADRVEPSNLQRQILHGDDDLGRFKVESGRDALNKLNPEVAVVMYRERLTPANALGILEGYDFVIDGTDGAASKFLVADAAHFANKPYCHAGVVRFEGQLMTVKPGKTACLRCLFDSPELCAETATCAESGILGAVAGVFGCLQAAEAVKRLLGIGRNATDEMIVINVLTMRSRNVTLRRNPDCPLCGDDPRIRALHEREADQGPFSGGFKLRPASRGSGNREDNGPSNSEASVNHRQRRS